MKKIILMLAVSCSFCFLSIISNAQTPNWLWAKTAGGSSNDIAYSVAVDASGNSFVTGWFGSPDLTFAPTTLTNNGADDIFLTKYDASGNVVWARSAGGTNHDYANSVAVDPSGNSYIVGSFTSDTIIFGSYTLINTDNTTNSTSDLFLVKYNSSGNVLWAKSAAGLNNDEAASVSVDASGNVYLTGYFSSYTLSFGTITLTNTDTINYTDDIFIAKYNSSGNVVWAKSYGGTGWDDACSIAVDASGNTYVAGAYDSPTIVFGTSTLTNSSSVDTTDIFITKFDASGNALWAKSAAGRGDDVAYTVALDASENSYVAGWFQSPSIKFGSTTLLNNDATGASNDLFIAKYNTSGNLQWVKRAGGDGNDQASSISVTTSGNFFLAGQFSSPSIIFGSDTLSNTGSTYYLDAFATKYDASGNVLWATSVGGTSDDQAYSVATDVSGNAYLAGCYYSPTIKFGATTLTNFDNTSNTADIFIAKLGSNSGINDFVNSSDILIYPNPADYNLTVKTPQSSEIEILNIDGQLLQIITSNENYTTINISGLARGMYFVKIKTEKGIEMGKFVKE